MILTTQQLAGCGHRAQNREGRQKFKFSHGRNYRNIAVMSLLPDRDTAHWPHTSTLGVPAHRGR